MRFIGIDPGVSGAIAVIDTDTDQVAFYDTPNLEVKSGKKFKKVIDIGRAVLMLQQLSAGVKTVVTIEKVNAMPGMKNDPDNPGKKIPAAMGVTSAFSFGMGFGMWLGVLAALFIPHQQVHSLTWKKSMMADMGKEKDASRIKAMQLYPRTAPDLVRKKDHGRADALLIADWGRRNYSEVPSKLPSFSRDNQQDDLFEAVK